MHSTRKEFSVALTTVLNQELREGLLARVAEGQEGATLALWRPSTGSVRTTAMLQRAVWPLSGECLYNGGVAITPAYFDRAIAEAANAGLGVALLHSHLGPGWQEMSHDDICTELRLAGPARTLTELPLVGMTLGTDGTWSARVWPKRDTSMLSGARRGSVRRSQRVWCRSVRVLGPETRYDFAARVAPAPKWRELFRSTRTVWGEREHANMARLRVGIVGTGSVGMIVVETLARMGIENLVLIDFDRVKPRNLDRLLGATEGDLGALKVSVAERVARNAATAADIAVDQVPASVVEERGYRAALDCDVLFSCVDRPWPRKVLNHIAYAHLIPVIDGGIDARFRRGRFVGADWQAMTITPGRRCLRCAGQFDPADVELERDGQLDNPVYLRGLPDDHRLKRNENVFPFSASVATLEVLQFSILTAHPAGTTDAGSQRYHFPFGLLETSYDCVCEPGCLLPQVIARADADFSLVGRDLTAARENAAAE